MHIVKVMGLAVALALAGCASFTHDEVAPVNLASVAGGMSKKDVYVHLEYHIGFPYTVTGDLPLDRAKFRPQIKRTLEASGLFGRITFDESQKTSDDHVMLIRIDEQPPSFGEMFMALLSEMTLTLIPSRSITGYKMTLVLVDPRGKALTFTDNHDAVDTWIGIWFLPVAGHTNDKAVNDTFDRQLNALLAHWVERTPAEQAAAGDRL